MALSTAVPLWIHEFKQRPWQEIQELATEGSQFLGEHGDALMYKQKGTTAKAFNYLAKGVAALAFVPGGVNTFGMHFEAVHPESIKGKGSRWFYHSTFADSLKDVAQYGLIPNKKPQHGEPMPADAVGKVFLAETPEQAGRYAAHTFSNLLVHQGGSWNPILLRVNSAHTADMQPYPKSFSDWFVARKIPWPFLQVWVPRKDAWIEVREVVKQGYLDEFYTKYGAPEEIDVDPEAPPEEYARKYMEDFWPKE